MRASRVRLLTLLLLLANPIGSHFVSAQTSDDLSALKQHAEQLYQNGRYSEALELQRQLAAAIEKVENIGDGKAGARTAEVFGGLAWYALFARRFIEALEAAERAHYLARDELWIEANHAHALLFLGRLREARAIYLAHKGERFKTSGKRWENSIVGDFEAFRHAGLDHGALGEITTTLGIDAALWSEVDALYNQVRQLYQGRKYAQAVPLAEKYVARALKGYGAEGPEAATAMIWLAALYAAQRRYDDAKPLYESSLAIREKVLGPDHLDVASSLNGLAILHEEQGRYEESELLKKRALAIHEKLQGHDHLDVAGSLNNLAFLYGRLGRYAEAEPLYKRSLAIKERVLGSENPSVANSLNNLAGLYESQARYGEAEPLYKRALAIREKALGPEHPEVGESVGNLAGLLIAMGRLSEAEPLRHREVRIMENALPADHQDLATALGNLAGLYSDLGRYVEAESLYKRSLAIREKGLGPNHLDMTGELAGLGLLYEKRGQYSEAEPMLKRALAIRDKILGPEHPDVAIALNNLAFLYDHQGRYTEAEPLYKRALAIREKTLSADHPDLAIALNNLGTLYVAQNRYADADPIFQRSLAIREKALGSNHPELATALDNLAVLYRSQGRFAEAEPLNNRALSIFEKALGSDHIEVGTAVDNLALLYYAQGRYAKAEALFKRSLMIRQKALGPDHSNVASVLNNLAALYFVQSDWVRAAEFWRRSTGIIVHRMERRAADVGQALTGKSKSEASQLNWQFLQLVKATHRLGSNGETTLANEMSKTAFKTAQWAQSSEAAASLAQMAARQAKGDGALAQLVRERQDLVGEWQGRDKLLVTSRSQTPEKRNAANETTLSARLAAIDARIAEIDMTLKDKFPDYAALASPEPLDITDVQDVLRSDETLVLFLDTPEWAPTPEETFIWLVTKTYARWLRIDLGTNALADRVAALRCGLDQALWDRVESEQKCRTALGASPTFETIKLGDKEVNVQVLPFDAGRAHELYKALLGPVEDLIKGKHLFIVPSGPLTSLPFNILVTQPPNTAIPAKLADYRDVAWLGARQPITVLPSVASLKALRQFAKTSHATKRYLGLGNPLLDGQQDHWRDGAYFKKQAQAARDKQQCPKTLSQRIVLAATRPLAGFAKLFRGANADIEEIRQWAPLPETADELCEVGRRLGVPEGDILLGARATETALKELSEKGQLADYAILHFATHGALTGQVQGTAEPGLILTPPEKGTADLERDDGFLTASEIATLKLDADWVILSACNTAGGSGETAEALSGMASAFFYAGARALLVSHWEVGSDAAVKLTTRAFAELKAKPKIGRAEAFRRSMKELIETGSPMEAHPSQWAPFVVVGEGAH